MAVDLVKLNQLLTQGKSGKECARILGVSEPTICKARKKLSLAVVKNVTLESGHRVMQEHLDTLGQLRKINESANELLDLLMRWNRGDKEALQILEGQVRKIRVKGSEEEVTEYRFKDPRELALKAMAEIRGQLNLQMEIFQTLYDVRKVAEFQQEVLQIIGEVDEDARNRIISRLRQRNAVRSAVEFNR